MQSSKKPTIRIPTTGIIKYYKSKFLVNTDHIKINTLFQLNKSFYLDVNIDDSNFLFQVISHCDLLNITVRKKFHSTYLDNFSTNKYRHAQSL